MNSLATWLLPKDLGDPVKLLHIGSLSHKVKLFAINLTINSI